MLPTIKINTTYREPEYPIHDTLPQFEESIREYGLSPKIASEMRKRPCFSMEKHTAMPATFFFASNNFIPSDYRRKTGHVLRCFVPFEVFEQNSLFVRNASSSSLRALLFMTFGVRQNEEYVAKNTWSYSVFCSKYSGYLRFLPEFLYTKVIAPDDIILECQK